MQRPLRVTLQLAVIAALVAAPAAAHAQFGNIAKKVKEKAGQRIDQRTDEAAAEAVDRADPTSDRNKAEATGDSAEAPGAVAATGGTRKVWANYDFIPGQRTLYFTDFTDEEVGNFPRRLTFKSGSMEVVELDGKRALKASTQSGFVVPLPEVMPEKFTIEIDVINRNSQGVAAATVKIYGGTEPKTDVDVDRTRLTFGHLGWEVAGGGTKATADFTDADRTLYVGQPASVRVLGDGAYLKLYVDGRRLANVPNANFLRDKGIFVSMEARDDEADAVYITRIRIAESQKTVYDALAANGRWATQGILFDIGKSIVKPESAPTLKAIASALTQHPELKIRIEGHTDNVGGAEANKRLSEARAAAVKAALVKDHAIDATRLEIAGIGDTKPVADNATAEGRSSNRRVEVVKL